MMNRLDETTRPTLTSDELVQYAALAVKRGQKSQARHYLQEAVRHDPQNYRAWLWLAGVASTPQASLNYVHRAEILRPNDPAVQEARLWAENRLNKVPAPEMSPPETEGGGSHSLFWLGGVALLLILVLGATAVFLYANYTGGSSESETAAAANVSVNNPTAADSGQPTSLLPPEVTPPPQIPAKNIGSKSDIPRPTWTATPIPSPTPTPAPTLMPTFISPGYQDTQRPFGVGPDERWVDVNLSTQYLTAFEGDTPVFETYISSGTPGFETVTGQFRIWLRYESQTMDGRLLGYDYYLENVPYVMYFYQDYALHGAYWHNNFGQPMSHGCVNIAPDDAGWLFHWTRLGTLVNVHY